MILGTKANLAMHLQRSRRGQKHGWMKQIVVVRPERAKIYECSVGLMAVIARWTDDRSPPVLTRGHDDDRDEHPGSH